MMDREAILQNWENEQSEPEYLAKLPGYFLWKGFFSSSKSRRNVKYRNWLESSLKIYSWSGDRNLPRYLPMDPMLHIWKLEAALLESSNTPPLTVAKMEGQSTGQRIRLRDYNGYDDFAVDMKIRFSNHMLKRAGKRDVYSQQALPDGESCTLMNAIPGYVIAYEDEEGDVLPAGEIAWRDFVRMAKQIKIVGDIKLPTDVKAVGEFEVEEINEGWCRTLDEILIH